jgi:cation transport ATPase
LKNFIEYIEKSCENIKDSQISYKYKRKLLDEMTERANEITGAGLRDEKVLADLIADEYPDLEQNYYVYEKEEKKKARASLLRKLFAVGGVLFFIAIFVAYFSVSKATGAWDKTWLIIVGGIFSMIIFYTSFLIKRLYHWHRFLHPLARVLIATCILLVAVFTFLFVLMIYNPGFSWVFVILGILISFVADLVFAFKTKQKFRTVFLFVYMPAIFTMLYIILAGMGIISWLTGWLLVFAGVGVDLIIIMAIIVHNAKYFMYKQEDEE